MYINLEGSRAIWYRLVQAGIWNSVLRLQARMPRISENFATAKSGKRIYFVNLQALISQSSIPPLHLLRYLNPKQLSHLIKSDSNDKGDTFTLHARRQALRLVGSSQWDSRKFSTQALLDD